MALSKSGYEALLHRLQEFISSSADVEYAAILTGDGTTLCSNWPKGVNEEQGALLLAASTAITSNLVDALSQEPLQHVVFECLNGDIVVVPLYNEMILAIAVRKNAKTGLIFLDVRRIFWQPASDLITPTRPPNSLDASARPEYDEPN
jgi:uncharacterized protein